MTAGLPLFILESTGWPTLVELQHLPVSSMSGKAGCSGESFSKLLCKVSTDSRMASYLGLL